MSVRPSVCVVLDALTVACVTHCGTLVFYKNRKSRPILVELENEPRIGHVQELELLIGGPESGPILVELGNERTANQQF